FPGLRNVAQFIFGFGLLFLSIKIMSVGVANIKYLSGFNAMIDWLNEYPIWGIILGTIFSFVFRSSTAVIGLILALSFESAIPLSSALLFVLGANLGTTIFPILISDTVYARRVALGNLFFKMIGVMICLPLIGFFENFLHFLGGTETRQIANFHTLFNVLISLIFLPLLHFFSDLIKAIVVETKKEILMKRKLDPSFLDTPAIGLGQAMKEVFYMADKAAKMLEDAIKVFERKDIVLRKEIIQADDEIDKTEEMLTTYISKLNTEEMDEDLRKTQVGLMTITAEIEHIGDIVSKSLMGYAKKQIDAGMGFSAEGFSEIKELHCFVLDTLRMAIASLTTRDKTLAQEILKRRETAIDMAKRFEVKHLERLHRGLRESIETSTIHLDILSELERINFHATEIGNAVIALIL
ncbi:MAG: Na/Pi cotransporter family protein, partial [candidate division WOR-3 bacterium]